MIDVLSQDCNSILLRWKRDLNLPIQPPRAQDCWVNVIRVVRSSDDYDAFPTLETIKAFQQRVNNLNAASRWLLAGQD
nr:hypothetical protein [Mycoplana dimorpha]